MMQGQRRGWLLGLMWASAALRFHALFANTFHADEALFATWARHIAAWRDPLLQSQLLDKPPLVFYLQALFYSLVGPVEWAARLPGLAASLLLIPLTAALVWRVYGQWLPAALASAAVAFSPLAIQFSATAFIDPVLVAFLMASFVAIVRLAPGWSGLWFGLATAAKFQAWLFLPLLLGLGWLGRYRRLQWRAWFLGLLPLLLLLLLWEALRGQGFTLLATQWSSVGGLRPVWSWELWPRLQGWGGLWGSVLGSPILAFGLLLAIPVFLAMVIHDQDRPTAYDQHFLIFVAAYFLWHWLLSVPVWDRYLLPILPIMAALLGRVASRIFEFTQPSLPESWPRVAPGGNSPAAWVVLAVFIGLLLPPALDARAGRYPVGGQATADGGAACAAAPLGDAPYGTVLYDHWFSWHWRYHLFDSGAYVAWFPHPQALADDLAVFGRDGSPRYLALPDSEIARPVQQAVQAAGFRLLPLPSGCDTAATPGIIIYQVLP